MYAREGLDSPAKHACSKDNAAMLKVRSQLFDFNFF